jgi:hypothetical protein
MRWAGARGQALTEFLVVVPLFLVLLLGVVQLGLLFFAYQTVHYASFTACRAAAVRPCMAFQPDDFGEPNFTPAVFSAAALATMAAMPSQDLFGGPPYTWVPSLPQTDPVTDLDFHGVDSQIYRFKYGSAAVLTSVRRVMPDFDQTPPEWDPAPAFEADAPCDEPHQNVPPTGYDVSLEVTLVYPMTIPFVNRVFYGVFVYFTPLAQDEIGIPNVPGVGREDVMVEPLKALPYPSLYGIHIFSAVQRVLQHYGYPSPGLWAGLIANAFTSNGRAWYPIPIRARTTLSVEAAPYRMMYR